MNLMGKRTVCIKVHLDEAQFADLGRLAISRDRKASDMVFSIIMDRLYGERRRFPTDIAGQFGPASTIPGHLEE